VACNSAMPHHSFPAVGSFIESNHMDIMDPHAEWSLANDANLSTWNKEIGCSVVCHPNAAHKLIINRWNRVAVHRTDIMIRTNLTQRFDADNIVFFKHCEILSCQAKFRILPQLYCLHYTNFSQSVFNNLIFQWISDYFISHQWTSQRSIFLNI